MVQHARGQGVIGLITQCLERFGAKKRHADQRLRGLVANPPLLVLQ